MGSKYTALTMEERRLIQRMLDAGSSRRKIALQLGRSPGTISRELGRNGQGPEGYEAASAHQSSRSRRREGRRGVRKLGAELDSPLGQQVRRRLKQGWSPQQVAGALKAEHGQSAERCVSHETIYRSIYIVPRGALRTELVQALRRSRPKRMPRARGRARSNLVNAIPISQRPAEVDTRSTPGHWEGDFIKGKGNRSAVGTLVERQSRMLLLTHVKGCTAQAAHDGFAQRLKRVPSPLRKTLTYDRGSEMALHEELAQKLEIKIYFCEPHSPWQRGSNENINGLVRQYLPKGMDLSDVSPQKLKHIEMLINTRPRKVLNYKTPLEVFNEMRNNLK